MTVTGIFLISTVLPSLFSIVSTALLFYIAYKLGGENVKLGTVLVLGVGINLVFILISLLIPAILSSSSSSLNLTLPRILSVVAPILVILVFYGIIATIIVFAGYSIGKKSESKSPIKMRDKKIMFVGFADRFIARLIDIVLIWAILISVASIFYFADIKNNQLLQSLWTVFVVLWFVGSEFYYIYFHHTTGQTIGKKVMKIKVVKDTGKPLSWKDAFIRWIGYKFSLLPLGIGLFWVVFDKNKQGWHDKISKTQVIKPVEKD